MFDEDKLKLMIDIAYYEQKKGEEDFERIKYYKMDYVRLQVLKTLLCVTISVLFMISLVVMYYMEYIITNALDINYISIGKYVLIIYLLLLCLFSFITVSVSSVKYEASKKRVKGYYSLMQQLIRYYEEENSETDSANERRDVSV